MAFNPVTGHLLLVNRYPTGGETINILDSTNGADVGKLDTSAFVLAATDNYYITPTRIPLDMYYKPPSIEGARHGTRMAIRAMTRRMGAGIGHISFGAWCRTDPGSLTQTM